MKLNHTITYLLYFGMAVMLSPLKYNHNADVNICFEKKQTASPQLFSKAKTMLHSELLFKY